MNKRVEKILEFDKIKDILSNYASSEMTKELIYDLHPYSDESIVKKLQQETSEGVTLLNSGIKFPIEGIKDIRQSLRRAQLGSMLMPKELLDIASTMRTSRLIKDIWEEKKLEDSQILNDLISSLHSFQSIEDKIFKAILNEDEIADDASPTLSSIRRKKNNTAQSIKDKLNSIITSPRYQKVLQEPIVTVRRDRYVVPIRQEYRGSIPGVIHDQSSSGATLYVEPMAVLELNNELRQLEIAEGKEIERILWDFTNKIKDNYDFIFDSLNSLIRLDFILAKASFAIEINGTEPFFNTRGFINIKNARHPLLKGKVVPIDVFLGDDFTVLVITGPNTGGKTVSLKTVGLLVLMAQSGLRIPAKDGTELGIFDEVFADIGDEQSIEQSLSTFSSHMRNIKDIVDECSENCLVLLDELGAGTDPTEGAALAMAILNYFYEKGSRVIATTHYSELKTFAFSKNGVENASVEFDVTTLSPTYKLTIGLPGKSNAFEIAKKLGLKQEIVDAAKSLMAEDSLKMEDLLRHIEQEKNEAIAHKEEIILLKQKYKEKLQQLEAEKDNLRIQQDKIIERAKEKAKNIIKKTEQESKKIISKLQQIDENEKKEIKDSSIETARTWLRKASRQLEDKDGRIVKTFNQKHDEPLNPGEKVRVLGLNQEGFIITIDESSKTAQVQVGIMKVNIPLSNLVKVEQQEIERQKSKYASIALEKVKNISTEIDLRGLTLDEALLKVDRYLDDAFMAGVTNVTLIHGKGTGVLRNGIQNMLRTRKNIKSFRLGNYDEGGAGVTVVELK